MKTYTQLKHSIAEKLFDGEFYKKTTQDEALEVLQQIGKIVDSRKVRENHLALREGVFVLIKRPMTAIGEGYLVVVVVEGSITKEGDAEAKVVKNYGGNDFRVGSLIPISNADVMGVSEDNKRFYVVYPIQKTIDKQTSSPAKSNGKGGDGDMMKKFKSAIG